MPTICSPGAVPTRHWDLMRLAFPFSSTRAASAPTPRTWCVHGPLATLTPTLTLTLTLTLTPTLTLTLTPSASCCR